MFILLFFFQMDENFANKSLTIIEKYIQRPPNFENLSLYEFVKTIIVNGKTYSRARKHNIVLIYPILKLMDIENVEDFYRQQCILQIPFRTNIDELWNSYGVEKDTTWLDNFENNNLTLIEGIQLPDSTDHVEEEQSIPENEIHYNAFEIVSLFIHDKHDQKLGNRLIDVTYDWNRNKNEFSPFDQIDAFLNSYRILNEPVCASNIQDVPNINLSSEQNEILNICKNYAKSIMNNTNNSHPESTTIKRIII